MDHRMREIVKKELVQLGVHPSVHAGLHVLSTDLVSLLDQRLICEQDWIGTIKLNVKKCGHISNTKSQS